MTGARIITTLGDITESADPGFASGENLRSGVAQLRMNNVRRDGTLDWSEIRRIPADARKVEKYSLRPGDIVFNSTNSPDLVGKTALFSGFKEPVLFSNHFLRLRVDAKHAEPGFIAWWLTRCWQQRAFESLCTRWVNQASVRKHDLLSLRIELPDLPEQKRVATMLEQAHRLRRIRRYALELSDTFLPAAFLELLDREVGRFPVVSVDELAVQNRGSIRTGPFGSQLLHSEFTDGGIAVLGIDNAVNNRFEWAERRFITLNKYEKLKRYTVHPGDVLITIMGTCGRCAIVPDNVGTAINTKHLCCITLDQTRCLPIYLQAAFLHHPFVLHQLRIATKGAIMQGLNMEIIKNLRIPLPPLAVQRRFAYVATTYERLRTRQWEAMRQAEHLFQTLLRQSFAYRS